MSETINMSTSPEPAAAAPETKTSRLGKIVRWAARLTSIPVFGLVMISLVPALASFAISAKDDKIIALGLCGTCLGLLLGWKWAGIGGTLTLLSVAVMLMQGDNSLSADPFSVAFGLQGILFLISWMLNLRADKTGSAGIGWVQKAVAGVLLLCALGGAAIIYRGPGPTAVPKEKQAYVGVWGNGSGFTLEITGDGQAKLSQDKDSKVNACNTPLAPGGAGAFRVYFRGDDRLELSGGVLGDSKIYHIDRRPFPQNKQIKMVLNGSDPYQRTNGMVLVKQAGK